VDAGHPGLDGQDHKQAFHPIAHGTSLSPQRYPQLTGINPQLEFAVPGPTTEGTPSGRKDMLGLLAEGEITLFALILFTIVLSLTCHEYGHAITAKWFGDDTAEKAGRLNLNPLNHIDPMGLLMVVMIGFGYAKPVPVSPRNFTKPWADGVVAFAGPLVNLLLAVLAVNLFFLGRDHGVTFLQGDGQAIFLLFMAQINLLLMLFNLIPLGPLDGHYILPWFLPKRLRYPYHQFNARYGNWLFLGLILLSILGVPIFSRLMDLASAMIPFITFV
jgi:Zn-dependent protease